jgi:hypothetical protein
MILRKILHILYDIIRQFLLLISEKMVYFFQEVNGISITYEFTCFKELKKYILKKSF